MINKSKPGLSLTYFRFMPADALWTLTMACNVYLSFFRKYSQHDLRGLEWKYGIFCYGIPFVPALAYLFVNNPVRGRVYGSAVVSLLENVASSFTDQA
jgi:hypothetical protein